MMFSKIVYAGRSSPFQLKSMHINCFRLYSNSSPIQHKVHKKLIYTSPHAGLIKLVKMFSLSTLSISAVATPAIMYFWDSPKIESVDTTNAVYLGETLTHHVSIQMIITAALASACSTGALSFLLSPYVNSIYLHTEEDENAATRITPNTVISIETLDILARQRTTTLKLRELSPVPQSSLLTWKVNKKVLAKELNLIEQGKGEKRIHQHRFWLDQRNGVGDREAMSTILRVINEQGRKRIFL